VAHWMGRPDGVGGPRSPVYESYFHGNRRETMVLCYRVMLNGSNELSLDAYFMCEGNRVTASGLHTEALE
jgi:hypothetical protein